MSVTARFVPDHIEVLPNTPTTLTLRLYNDDADTREVTLSVSGDLGDNVRLDSTTATIETNQIVDVAVTVLAPPSIEAGTYTITTEVGLGVVGSAIGGCGLQREGVIGGRTTPVGIGRDDACEQLADRAGCEGQRWRFQFDGQRTLGGPGLEVEHDDHVAGVRHARDVPTPSRSP